jgi:hypothetical protein
MKFKVIDRSDYEILQITKKIKVDFSKMLNQKCDICKQKDWVFSVDNGDNDSFEYLFNLGCPHGYVNVCKKCFDNHIDNYSWAYYSIDDLKKMNVIPRGINRQM